MSLKKLIRDPYGEGWMIKVKCSDLSQLDNLMSADDYKELNRCLKNNSGYLLLYSIQ